MTLPAGSEDPDSATLWSAFWRTGARNGCTSAFPAAAQQAIRAGWHSVLAAHPPDTRLLDIACGRGAVLAIAAAAGIAHRTGVDLAAADAVAAAGERIMGGIDARALPFADHSFDLVVSQFGIEYAGLDAAMSEAARVAARDLVLLLHAGDGEVVAQAREQAEQAAWIDTGLDGFGALARGGAALRAVLDQVARAGRTARNTALLEAFCQNARAIAGHPDPALRDGFAREWRAHGSRMRDLARAAPDAAAARAAAAALADRGFAAELSDLRAGGALVGRWLSARRRS